MTDSTKFFILLEITYLLLFVFGILSDSKIGFYPCYCLAGIKFSISAINSVDIIQYDAVYNSIGKSDFSNDDQMEIGFLYLIYIASKLYIPLTLLHSLEIIFFLISINFLLSNFIAESKAVMVTTMLFGFFAVGGELCMYLLRQLLSTSIVFMSLGLFLRNKVRISLLVFISSFLFHSSSIFYVPFFIANFFKSRRTKTAILIILYTILIVVFAFPESTSLFSSFFQNNSLYSKYEGYSARIGEEGWRDDNRIGIFAIGLFCYNIFINALNSKFKFKYNKKQLYFYKFCVIFFGFYFASEFLQIFWISSRVKFIAIFLLLISSFSLTTNYLSNKQIRSAFLHILPVVLCILSVIGIFQNQYKFNNVLYILPSWL